MKSLNIYKKKRWKKLYERINELENILETCLDLKIDELLFYEFIELGQSKAPQHNKNNQSFQQFTYLSKPYCLVPNVLKIIIINNSWQTT